jgi:hypothetical protein
MKFVRRCRALALLIRRPLDEACCPEKMRTHKNEADARDINRRNRNKFRIVGSGSLRCGSCRKDA